MASEQRMEWAIELACVLGSIALGWKAAERWAHRS